LKGSREKEYFLFASGSVKMDDDKLVWAPDTTHGFTVGKIVDIGSETISVEPLNAKGKVIKAPYNRVFPAEDDLSHDVDDNCSLMYLNEATLLHNLKIRYQKDEIYTYVANILIAVNPYHDVGKLYDKETIKNYKGKSIGVLKPHVFAIADKAYRDMKTYKESQSVVVSGESGAGKTESTKYILRYLVETVGSGETGHIERRIVEANPLLESFGNAKTLRNTNSSRFGKYVEVHFNDKANLVGAYISHYLLEKSRVCKQSKGERNYHVFYRMCAGAPEDMKRALKLNRLEAFNYLKTTPHTTELDDVGDFKRMEQAMDAVGISIKTKMDIYRVVAAVLHLGNVNFEENTKDKKGGCEVAASSEGVVQDVAKLLAVEPSELKMSLATRVMTTTKGGGFGTMYKVPLKIEQACAARDALAKAIYSKLFDHIVSCVNQCFPFKASENFIGVLDIAGFEFFEVNSFEQFCINYCNEKLQQFFNERILRQEQELYDKEGLGVKTVSYIDNQDCIDLIETKSSGIMDLLNEEGKLPKSSEEHFTIEVHQRHGKHFRLALPRKSPLQAHRNLRDDQGFIVRHFAGAVCYQTAGFLEKNDDALHGSLEALVHESKDEFILNLFPAGSAKSKKKLAFDSVSTKFKTQLGMLMEKLKSTGSNFIRCIKPNDKMKRKDFEGVQILSQLQCAGMVSVLELMQNGYPSRAMFSSLYEKYKGYLPPKLAALDPRTFCQALFRAIGIGSDDFKFGMSKVFFRPGKFAEFDQLMKSDPETLNALVAKVQKWIICNRWKRAIWGSISVQKLANKIKYRRELIVKIQKTVRMFLSVAKHKPRYKGVMKVRRLQKMIMEMKEQASSLKKDSETVTKQVKALEMEMEALVKKIKDTLMRENQINTAYNDLFNKMSNQTKDLQNRLKAQKEEERLRKIQEQMELERKRKEEEERKKRMEEEERKRKLELEERLRREAEEFEKRRKEEEEASRLLLEKLKLENEEAERARKAQEEQEKRDYDLALRLSTENDNSVKVKDPQQVIVEDIAPSKPPTSASKGSDLRAMKYDELRAIINTSTDVELLTSCRAEFHRRLKVYHDWRKKNKQTKAAKATEQRAPLEVIKNSEEVAVLHQQQPAPPQQNVKAEAQAAQRFFRVPFAKPANQYRSNEYKKSGWWYAHFDGEWVARQLEIHPNGVLLLIAGRDDLDMCELSLSQCGLTRRQGAEITRNEFEAEWQRYGGANQNFRAKPRK